MSCKKNTISLDPIGYVSCDQKYRYEAPRQAVFADNNGYIELCPEHNFEMALCDLEGFNKIWIIFAFHLNSNWRPKVTPPIKGVNKKVGVFATRSPHRPNPIGMSCVDLVSIEGRKLYIKNFDILDGTPVLDIKPYIIRSDSHPEALQGWLPRVLPDNWNIAFSSQAKEQSEFIRELSGLDLEQFCSIQLVNEPLVDERKRIKREGEFYSISCRTWRMLYTVDGKTMIIFVNEIRSNYTPEELLPGVDDVYGDKGVHRRFVARWSL